MSSLKKGEQNTIITSFTFFALCEIMYHPLGSIVTCLLHHKDED